MIQERMSEKGTWVERETGRSLVKELLFADEERERDGDGGAFCWYQDEKGSQNGGSNPGFGAGLASE